VGAAQLRGGGEGAGHPGGDGALAALPTDPDALLRWAYAQAVSARITTAIVDEPGERP